TDVSPSLTITGTLSSDVDVDVYQFDTTDTAEASTNSYAVEIKFTAPATNNEFVMDVIRGSTCSDTPTGAGTNITSYDWGVNGSSGGVGEAPCGPTAANHCGGTPTCNDSTVCPDHSSRYYVRVYRKGGGTATCDAYTLDVTAHSTTACDFTSSCP